MLKEIKLNKRVHMLWNINTPSVYPRVLWGEKDKEVVQSLIMNTDY